MNERDFINIGNEIGRAVQDALHSIDFIQIKESINTTIQSTVSNVQEAINHVSPPPPPRPVQPVQRQPVATTPYPFTSAPKQKKTKIPGNVAGILLIVFGSIGVGVLSLLFLLYSILALVRDSVGFFTGLPVRVILGLLAAEIVAIGMGTHLRKRVRRYRCYQAHLIGRRLCPVEELASAIGRTPKFVARDLKKMIRLGMFPDGHLDKKQTSLILDYETYRQYLRAEEMAEQKRLDEEQRKNQPPAADSELTSLLADGRRMVLTLRETNEAIPEEAVSAKLTRLEKMSSSILRYVELHPEKLPEIRRFMNYYMPTALKLAATYWEYYEHPLTGDAVEKTKAEIENALDTLGQAFANLLEDLVEDDAMDVATDITVLKTILAQEGLTDQDFPQKK